MRLIRLKVLGVIMFALPFLAPAGRPGLGDRNYYIRIGIVPDARCIALKPTANYTVLDGEGRAKAVLAAGEVYYLTLGRPSGGEKVFRIVIREIENVDQTENAHAVAKAAEKAFGIPARTLRKGSEDRKGKDRLLVTVGEFSSLSEAQEYRRNLKGLATERILEDKASAGGGRVVLQARGGSRVASDGFSLRLIPGDLARDSLFISRASRTGEFDSNGMKGERHYRGNVVVSVNRKGTLTAVNHVWMEQYVYGVTAAELGNFAPFEALKAQAVAARSEAVAKFEKGLVSSDPLYDFDDSAMIQSYKGMGLENAEVRRAVDATKGEVLVWNGSTIDAVYSHSCGGVVSSMTDHWGGEPKGYSVRLADRLHKRDTGDLSTDSAARAWTELSQDVFCNPLQRGFPQYATKNFRWGRTYTASELERLLGVGKVFDVSVVKRTASGRVHSLRVKGDKRTATYTGEMDIRGALGDIKSTFFTFDLSRGSDGHVTRMELRGAGFGHGVGMCQMGAYVMGLKGYPYRQILGFYYANVKIRKLY